LEFLDGFFSDQVIDKFQRGVHIPLAFGGAVKAMAGQADPFGVRSFPLAVYKHVREVTFPWYSIHGTRIAATELNRYITQRLKYSSGGLVRVSLLTDQLIFNQCRSAATAPSSGVLFRRFS
jgi:hypothetical protein